MAAADLALGLTALAMLALRAAGLAVAGALRADHPFVAWATAVSQATLAAFVVLAVVAPPAGAMAAVRRRGRGRRRGWRRAWPPSRRCGVGCCPRSGRGWWRWRRCGPRGG